MRVVLYIVYLYSFLLAGSNHGLREQSQNHGHFTTAQQFTQPVDAGQIHKIQEGTSLDDADGVVEEENIGSEVRDDNPGKVLFAKYFTPTRFFSRPVTLTGTDYRLKGTKAAPPVSGTSSPIYIKQRVLRI